MTATRMRRLKPGDVRVRLDDPVDTETLEKAASIVRDVRRRGEVALREHALRLGDLVPGALLVHERGDLAAALRSLPAETRGLLQRTAARIGEFAEAQRECIQALSHDVPGGAAGHTLEPVQSAGCYAPGGRFPLPSSVLMTAVTARAAGVETVWVASPRPPAAVLAAAALAGADAVLAAGGAHAIVALASETRPLA